MSHLLATITAQNIFTVIAVILAIYIIGFLLQILGKFCLLVLCLLTALSLYFHLEHKDFTHIITQFNLSKQEAILLENKTLIIIISTIIATIILYLIGKFLLNPFQRGNVLLRISYQFILGLLGIALLLFASYKITLFDNNNHHKNVFKPSQQSTFTLLTTIQHKKINQWLQKLTFLPEKLRQKAYFEAVTLPTIKNKFMQSLGKIKPAQTITDTTKSPPHLTKVPTDTTQTAKLLDLIRRYNNKEISFDTLWHHSAWQQ